MENMSPSKGLSRGLIGKLQEMFGHGIDKSTVFQNTPKEKVDQFVKEVGPRWMDLGVELLERQFQDYTGVFRVPVNYDEPNAIAKAIEEAGLDSKSLGIPLADIPLVGSGQAVREVREAHFGRVMYNRDLPNALKDRGESLGFRGGFGFNDPLTALRFACANRDRQRKYPLAILFTDSKGQLCYLYLRESAGERGLYVYRDYPGSRWNARVRFLVVCELPLGA